MRIRILILQVVRILSDSEYLSNFWWEESSNFKNTQKCFFCPIPIVKSAFYPIFHRIPPPPERGTVKGERKARTLNFKGLERKLHIIRLSKLNCWLKKLSWHTWIKDITMFRENRRSIIGRRISGAWAQKFWRFWKNDADLTGVGKVVAFNGHSIRRRLLYVLLLGSSPTSGLCPAWAVRSTLLSGTRWRAPCCRPCPLSAPPGRPQLNSRSA